MEIVDDFRQIFLCLILTGNVRELDAVGGLDVDLCVALAHVKHHGIGAAHLLHELFGHPLPQPDENHQRQHPGQQQIHQRRHLLDNFAGKLCAGIVEPVHKSVITDDAGFIVVIAGLVRKQNLVIGNFHLTDFFVFRHVHKGAVIDFLHLFFRQIGYQQHVDQQHGNQHQDIIEYQRFFRLFHFVHRMTSLCGSAAFSFLHSTIETVESDNEILNFLK